MCCHGYVFAKLNGIRMTNVVSQTICDKWNLEDENIEQNLYLSDQQKYDTDQRNMLTNCNKLSFANDKRSLHFSITSAKCAKNNKTLSCSNATHPLGTCFYNNAFTNKNITW